ncbi:23S rRNA pseudouridine synthase F [Candidatus Uhrbacteria bacterium CG10_big_fil_rev_8_21_14_0_10_48_11]|uniref:Pseudouridine synthase n=1 Tax=Candidatus Uhrbacteria bacterium CG10_big_fil_rev_8_21_14_0_10_48_11 TaxID=1975037 RepID=A0A2M8LED6_9BACT|nr:MAG: 23S rRNA pseudouridine synthase F [Candidatus Uhrbacteria bacterium CG10_big_fil_rev_8_21_14_0_10_48_11]
MPERINKFIAARSQWSRRQADELIARGLVTVNGTPVTPGATVTDADTVTVNGMTISAPAALLYLMLNKPIGYITTTDRRMSDNVLDLVPSTQRLFPVGRLDVLSSGLLLLTNDGELTNRLTHPRFEHEKEYVVEVDKTLTEDKLDVLRHGIRLRDKLTLPAKVRRLTDRGFSIAIREGKNRQIRRMCEYVGYNVINLRRTRVLSLSLGNLTVGRWRYLSAEEITHLRRDTGLL